ncbi:MAG: ATP-binding protein [Sphaerochaetaceae bacterium]|nr:ATP-binding protein [Spirochaetales bacterium]MDY5500942.1 ATP-binding protein [Sphaerochaetaceae bacterium]
MRIYVYVHNRFPDAALVSWQESPATITCTSYSEHENRELRNVMRNLLGRQASGRCLLSQHVGPEDLGFALAIAMRTATLGLSFSVLVVGKGNLEGKLAFSSPPYQFGQVARRYQCDLILMPMETKTSFPQIRRCSTVFDAIRQLLAYKPGPYGGQYPLRHVHGIETAKRALLLSLAGRLHLLLVGPPGCGKTFLLSEAADFLEDTVDFWVRSSMSAKYLLEHRVFSLVAGGRLILDELPSLQKTVLGAVRTEMDDNPDLLVQAAMNPCPCAATGQQGYTCICSEREKRQYWHAVGIPLLDRFDLKVRLRPREDWSTHIDTQIPDWKERMNRCLSHRPALQMCSQTALKASRSIDLGQLTPRGRLSMARIALTIAEWDGKMTVDQSCLAEAMAYRSFRLDEEN